MGRLGHGVEGTPHDRPTGQVGPQVNSAHTLTHRPSWPGGQLGQVRGGAGSSGAVLAAEELDRRPTRPTSRRNWQLVAGSGRRRARSPAYAANFAEELAARRRFWPPRSSIAGIRGQLRGGAGSSSPVLATAALNRRHTRPTSRRSWQLVGGSGRRGARSPAYAANFAEELAARGWFWPPTRPITGLRGQLRGGAGSSSPVLAADALDQRWVNSRPRLIARSCRTAARVAPPR